MLKASTCRDHYVRAWTTALAGGVKGDLVYGRTDNDGVDVKDGLVTEGDFFATIYTALGLDPLAGSRPIPIAPLGRTSSRNCSLNFRTACTQLCPTSARPN